MVHLTTYLLALDEQYDRQAMELRKCLRRAKEAAIFSRILQVQLVEAHASAAAAESVAPGFKNKKLDTHHM